MEQKLSRLKESMDHTVLSQLTFTEKHKENVRKALQLSKKETELSRTQRAGLKPKKITGKWMTVVSSAACLALLVGGLTYAMHQTPPHSQSSASNAYSSTAMQSDKGTATNAPNLAKSNDTAQPKMGIANSNSVTEKSSSNGSVASTEGLKVVRFSAIGSDIWMVTTNGVYVSHNQGQNFQEVETVQAGEFIGAGAVLNNNTALVNIIRQDGTTDLLQTTDGGATWTDHKAPYKGEGTFSFINSNTGWYLASEMDHQGTGTRSFKLYQTTDGGSHWTDISGSQTVNQTTMASGIAALHLKANLEGLTFVNDQKGYLYNKTYNETHSVYLYQTSDGGKTWSPINLKRPAEMRGNLTESLDTIHMMNGQVGTFVMNGRDLTTDQNKFVVYTTKDGGQSWTPSAAVNSKIEVTSSMTQDRLFVTDGFTMYVYDRDGKLLSQSQLSNESGGPVTLQMLDNQTGYLHVEAPKTALLYKTSDGGKTWTALTQQ